jgi:cell fate (sporulation/competence/biofilm development) regulator YmcA (YheA/YmcA/DUF963 family)
MTELDELYDKVDSLLASFHDLPIVQKYQALSSAIKEDKHLMEINEQRERLQSSIRYLKNEKKDEAIKACKELQIEYDNDPLVINFLSTKEEILKLIEPLTETKL